MHFASFFQCQIATKPLSIKIPSHLPTRSPSSLVARVILGEQRRTPDIRVLFGIYHRIPVSVSIERILNLNRIRQVVSKKNWHKLPDPNMWDSHEVLSVVNIFRAREEPQKDARRSHKKMLRGATKKMLRRAAKRCSEEPQKRPTKKPTKDENKRCSVSVAHSSLW